MRFTERLLRVADAYCEAVRLSRGRVSTLIFGDGGRLDGIGRGKDLNTRSFERAMAWFADNWPEAAAWPEGIERPDLATIEALLRPITTDATTGQGAVA